MCSEGFLFRPLPLLVVLGLLLHIPGLGAGPVIRDASPRSMRTDGVDNPARTGTGRALLQDAENDKHPDDVVKELLSKLNRSALNPLATSVEERCGLVKGPWCMQYHLQPPVPRFPPEYHNKPCPNNCSGLGNCNYEYGLCYCPAGWGGPDCSQPRKRPCAHMGLGKRDAGWHNLTSWSHTRCSGICDDDIGMCYCPPETKYGRKEAPPGSPPGAPPLQQGRPLLMCNPGTDKDGKKVQWGVTPYEDLFGPQGWCNADKPEKFKCPCRLDGLRGQLCETTVEQVCVNQCSGHGQCDQGFCRCYDGWYGVDCGLRREGKLYEDGDQLTSKPWIADVITHVVATEDPPLTPVRHRPFIYVYDMKSDFGTDLLQYRIEGSHCVYRNFESDNRTFWIGYNGYSIEPVLHELFLTSEHRTLNPKEADYFYVPVNVACLFDVYGWNEIPRWPQGLLAPRSHGAAMMQREAMEWLNATFPWFARRGGRDHIWLTPHDEGACYVWREIWPGVMLTHWGRTDFPHSSGTAYGMDNYTIPIEHDIHPGDWRDHTSRLHPCYDPRKDLVIPSFKEPAKYVKSPYWGLPIDEPPPKRDIFAIFCGDMRLEPGRDPNCVYSRCIRQRLLNLSRENHWEEAYNVWIKERIPPGSKYDYSTLLARSTFCFVLPGDGFSPRLEDAILHGCIPVIIMDEVQVAFESILDLSQFSVRIEQSDLAGVVGILKLIPADKVATMQAAIARVWHRYRYLGLRPARLEAQRRMTSFIENHGGNAPRNAGSQYSVTAEDDAFATIMQWLYSRVPAVHRLQVQAQA